MSDERRTAMAKLNMYRCLIVFAMVMAACAAVAIIVCGVVVVKPVIETKSLEFEKTRCTTTKGYLTGRWMDCSCGDKCSSAYPCLRILVTHGGKDNGTYSAVLFDTEQRLNSNGHLGEDSQCAFAPCDRNRNTNMGSVKAFNDTHSANEVYDCLYHPDDTAKVLLKRLFTWDAMFHSMLWPCIAFAIFLGLFLFFGYQCYKAGKTVRSLPIVVPPGAPAAQPGYFIPQAGQAQYPQAGQPQYPQAGQAQYPQAMPMQQQDPYRNVYSTNYDQKGFNYN